MTRIVCKNTVNPSGNADRWCITGGDPAAVVTGYTVLARRLPCTDHLPATTGPRAGQPVDAGDCVLCAIEHRVVLLHLRPRAAEVGLNYASGTIVVPEGLIGKTLADARQLLHDLNVAYIRQLLSS